MTTTAVRRTRPILAPVGMLTGLLATALFTLAAAVTVGALGLWAVVLIAYAAVAVTAIVRPKQTALALLVLGIVFEPAGIDFTRPIGAAIYSMPPGWEDALGLTTSPIEIATAIVAVSLVFRRQAFRRNRLPAIVWAVPAAMFMGLAYGLYKGGPSNLAYTEMRGLITACAIFVIATRCGPENVRLIVKTALVGVGLLASIVLLRYLVYIKFGPGDVAVETAFAHEGSIILGVGLIVAFSQLMRARDMRSVVGLSAYCLFVLVAMMATGRRSATLVLLVGALSVGSFSFVRRPTLTLVIALPLLAAFGAYLGAYWNKEYGAMAQPARAIRSQFDPSPRDDSSDIYRTIEKTDATETIRLNRTFGVGFGRPFIQFQPLPDLTSFWPLQFYTPHQNILWLWLKMGWLGVSIFLAFAVVLLKRCLETMHASDRDGATWSMAAVLFTIVVMFIVFSTVDLGFAGARALAAVAIAAGFIFQLKPDREATPL